jgi:Sec-independent protein translocase protein TatA
MEILNIGPLELIIILMLMFIILGPKDMVKTAQRIGRWVRSVTTSPMWREVWGISQDIREPPKKLMDESGLQEALTEVKQTTQEVANELNAQVNEVTEAARIKEIEHIRIENPLTTPPPDSVPSTVTPSLTTNNPPVGIPMLPETEKPAPIVDQPPSAEAVGAETADPAAMLQVAEPAPAEGATVPPKKTRKKKQPVETEQVVDTAPAEPSASAEQEYAPAEPAPKKPRRKSPRLAEPTLESEPAPAANIPAPDEPAAAPEPPVEVEAPVVNQFTNNPPRGILVGIPMMPRPAKPAAQPETAAALQTAPLAEMKPASEASSLVLGEPAAESQAVKKPRRKKAASEAAETAANTSSQMDLPPTLQAADQTLSTPSNGAAVYSAPDEVQPEAEPRPITEPEPRKRRAPRAKHQVPPVNETPPAVEPTPGNGAAHDDATPAASEETSGGVPARPARPRRTRKAEPSETVPETHPKENIG